MTTMFNKIKSAMIAIAGVAVFCQAQTSCPHFLLESPMVVNIEGFFINEKMSRVSLDVEWRHHPEALDTFFVNQPDVPKFNFITAGEYRYMEFPDIKVKRQLGTHHLKEHIGETPLKLDDMELLANGQFLCRDSSIQKPNILSTAFSMAWWSLITDSLPHPTRVTMNGPRKERRPSQTRRRTRRKTIQDAGQKHQIDRNWGKFRPARIV
jgi:hypothetical protein